MNQTELTKYTDLVYDLSSSMGEPDWFLKKRLKSFSLLKDLTPPKIERLNYSKWSLWQVPNGNNLVEKSSIGRSLKPSDEVLVIRYKDAHKTHADLFQRLYEQADFVDANDLFDAYHLAFLTSGLLIYIPEGVHASTPIEIEFIEEGQAENHQVFIYAEANSSVQIIERYHSKPEKLQQANLNVHVHIQAQTGANVKYTAIDELDGNTTAFFRRTGKTGRDAALKLALGVMNDGNTIEDIRVDLQGEGSSADVKAVAISHGKQTQCANTHVVNHGAHTVGNIYQHGVVLDEATLTFNGIGDVLNNAKHSDAQQESRILMLSDNARADTNPILLIDEYELTAGHAASVSRVDEEQLYYLMSRGLERKQSEKLVIRGFLGNVLSAIPVKEVQKKFIDTIERKLSSL